MSMNLKSNNKANFQLSESIVQLESYIRDFWKFLPLPICYLNPLYLILDADQEMEKFSGYDTGEIIGENPAIDYNPGNNLDADFTWADNLKAFKLLGWEPETSLYEGIKKTVVWYQENREALKGIEF